MEKSDHDPNYQRFLAHFMRDRNRLLAYIYTLLPNQADAEDVFQRSSMVLWEKFGAFEEERDFLAWARGVAFYEVKNFLRVSGRNRLAFDDELLAQLSSKREKDENQEVRLGALRTCLKKLGAKDQALIAQVYQSEYSIKQMAERGEQSVQTLYNRLSRSRRALYECIQMKVALADQGGQS